VVNLCNALESAVMNSRKLQSEKDKMESGFKLQMKDLEDKNQVLILERDTAAKAAEDISNRLTKLTVSALELSSEPGSWDDAVQSCGGDYVKAAKMYPQLKLAAIRSANPKRK